MSVRNVSLGPLPEPFMELHRDLAPHVYEAWANQMRAYATEQVLAERAANEQALAVALADAQMVNDRLRERCADIVRNAAAHGLCCADYEALADLVAGV